MSSSLFALGAKRPKVKTTPVPTPIPTSTSISTPSPIGSLTDEIISLAKNSNCHSYSFKNRGKAPTGYIQGMALSFARSYCRAKKSDSFSNGIVDILTSPNSKKTSTDALAYYQNQFDSFSINLSEKGSGPLRAVYTLGIGLGMRESSGKFCEGYDKAAGSNRSSNEAEAGLFQTSYNSINSSKELQNLYLEYQTSNSSRCYLEIFKQDVNCSNQSYLGSGEGLKFQKLTRDCPAFAAEYAMVMLRIARSHYGPINRKEAELVNSCSELITNIQDVINKDPQGYCNEIY